MVHEVTHYEVTHFVVSRAFTPKTAAVTEKAVSAARLFVVCLFIINRFSTKTDPRSHLGHYALGTGGKSSITAAVVDQTESSWSRKWPAERGSLHTSKLCVSPRCRPEDGADWLRPPSTLPSLLSEHHSLRRSKPKRASAVF